MSRYQDPLLKIPTSIDILYILGIFIAFISFSFIEINILYLSYFVLLWSIYQDWQSARVAETRPHWYFLISDLITVWNYVALFLALAFATTLTIEGLERVWLHWGLVFVIYIVWNIVMSRMPNTDKDTKAFFIKYSLLEFPIVVYCFVLYLEGKTRFLSSFLSIDLNNYVGLLILILTGIHFGLLFYWVYQTYLAHRNSQS